MTVIKMTGTNCTTYAENRAIEYLAVHYSAGTDCRAGKGKDLISWFRNPDADGSADYVVDEADLYQYNPDPYNRYCHAVGGGRYNTKGGRLYGVAGNRNCISLEIVSGNKAGKITYPNDPNYYFTDAVVEKAKEAVIYLMKLYGIDADHVIRHYDVNGKCCPGIIGWNADSGSEDKWEEFHKAIGGEPIHWFRVRLSWDDPASQIEADLKYENAVACADAHPGYSVFDDTGKCLYTSKSHTSTEEQWIHTIAPIAQELARKNKVLPSVVIAQTCLETGFGKTDLAQRFNIVGMKADLINNTWKDYTVWDGQSYWKYSPEGDAGEMKYSEFRMYHSYAECLEDYEMFLLHVQNNKGLKYARLQGLTDPAEVIHIIRIGTGTDAHPEGYATDSRYEKKVLEICQRYNLTQYDTAMDGKVAPKNILECMAIMQSQLEADIKALMFWIYSNLGCAGTFAAAVKKGKRKANCATIANWALKMLGILKSGMYVYGKADGTLSWNIETESAIREHCDVIHINGKKGTKKAIKDGTLKPGDIVTYQNFLHTNVYAGGEYWYDAGRGNTEKVQEGSNFKTWYCKKTSDDAIAYIIRVKTEEKKVYRVQIGAYKSKKGAKECAETCYDRTGFGAFYEQEGTLYKVYCGSYEYEENAEFRLSQLQKAGYKDAFIKEVVA